MLKRVSTYLVLLAVIVFVALALASGTKPVKAQTRQMTLKKVGANYILVDSAGASGTLTVTTSFTDGTSKSTQHTAWVVTGASAYVTVTFTGGRDTIMFLTGANVIGYWYTDTSLFELYSNNQMDHTFRPYDIVCGMTETHLTTISALAGFSSPYTGHINKIARFKAPHDFACQFSLTVDLNPSDTFSTYDITDAYSAHIPGFVTNGGTGIPQYTCTRSTTKLTDCYGWLPPDNSWQLDMYYSNPIKPHSATGNDFYSWVFRTGGDNSNTILNWTNFTIQ